MTVNSSLSALRIGVWRHYFQPEYTLANFLQENFSCRVREVDFKTRGYLDDLDILLIEQNGLNDYVENNCEYMHDFVAAGKICWLQHQDHERWSTAFLPAELGRPYLVKRYQTTISANHRSYLLPWFEDPAHPLFSSPHRLENSELVYWDIPGNSFAIQRPAGPANQDKAGAGAGECGHSRFAQVAGRARHDDYLAGEVKHITSAEKGPARAYKPRWAAARRMPAMLLASCSRPSRAIASRSASGSGARVMSSSASAGNGSACSPVAR